MNEIKQDLRVELMIDDQLYTFHGTVNEHPGVYLSYYNCTHAQVTRHIGEIRKAFIEEMNK